MGSSGGGGGGGGFSLPGALIGGIGSLASGVSNDVMTGIANIMNLMQRQEAMGWLNQIGPGSQGYQDLIDKSQAHIGEIAQNSQQAMGLYQDAVKRAGEGGIQERRDLNRTFDSLRAATEADLTERGLNATTVVPSVMGGIERNRADALGGLNERLRSERFGFDMGGLNLGQQLFGQGMQSTFAMQQFPYEMQMNDIMRRLTLQSGFNNYPPNPALSQSASAALGSWGVNPPQAQAPNTMGPALVGGGLGLAGGLGTAGILSSMGPVAAGMTLKGFVCIDENTQIRMADGTQKRLHEIRKGMIVLGASGKARKVLGVDLGVPRNKTEHIRLVFDKTYIVLSKDHFIHGRMAGDWKVGEELGGWILKRIELASPIRTGDLLLENGEGYVANGIAIASMLAASGTTEKMLDEFHAMMA